MPATESDRDADRDADTETASSLGRTNEEVMHGGCSATCVSTSEVHKEPLESSDLPWVELLPTHDDDVDVQLLHKYRKC